MFIHSLFVGLQLLLVLKELIVRMKTDKICCVIKLMSDVCARPTW